MNPDWAGLPQHLLDLILDNVKSPSTYKRFSLVCMSWHSAAKDYKKQCAKTSSSHHHPPMLLIPTGKYGMWKFYDVMDNRVLDLQLDLGYTRFCGSSNGWLIAVEKDFSVTLINPFVRLKGRTVKENSIFRLPPITLPDYVDTKIWARICNDAVFKATVSADPVLNPNDCIVMVICEDCCQMAFFRLSRDTTWTYVDRKWSPIDEVVSIEHKFYALDFRGQLLSFDITTQARSGIKRIARAMNSFKYDTKRYLVNLNEREFLMVMRCFSYKGDKKETRKFKVFQLDFGKRRWIATSTVGDVALFVGDNSSISVLASEFSGCRPNCVYFSHDNDFLKNKRIPYEPHDFGVYDLKNRSISQPYAKIAKTLIKKARRPPIWVAPSFQL